MEREYRASSIGLKNLAVSWVGLDGGEREGLGKEGRRALSRHYELLRRFTNLPRCMFSSVRFRAPTQNILDFMDYSLRPTFARFMPVFWPSFHHLNSTHPYSRCAFCHPCDFLQRPHPLSIPYLLTCTHSTSLPPFLCFSLSNMFELFGYVGESIGGRVPGVIMAVVEAASVIIVEAVV